jgi:U3 small nucleolar RNA-associated protein 12
VGKNYNFDTFVLREIWSNLTCPFPLTFQFVFSDANNLRKYEHSKALGLIASSTSNVLWTADDHSRSSTKNTGAGRAVVAANEEILCWDIKKGELLSRWRDNSCKAQVTAIARSKADSEVFAVGYEDGSIRIWDSKIATVIVNFNGHRSAVTALTFDKSGTRLASGGKDTDIIIWDLVSEVGLFRLRGHKDQVTSVYFLHPQVSVPSGGDEGGNTPSVTRSFESSHSFLLTTGKDSLIKLWDISTQHCIETHVAQSNGGCWALCVSPDGIGCITAGNDGEMKVWSIDTVGLYEMTQVLNRPLEHRYLKDRGVLHRQGKDNALEIHFHPQKDYFSVHGSGKAIEIWKIRSEDEVRKSLARKRRRRREKLAATGEITKDTVEVRDGIDGKAEDVASADITDVFVPYVTVRTSGRVRSVDWTGTKSTKHIELLVSTTDNRLELYKVPIREHSKMLKNNELPEYTRAFSVDQPGHRADIRTLVLSSDDKMLASASNGGLKIWNVKTCNCIRTFECGYALCCSFLPGDKIVVIGTKTGELELFDVTSATMLDTIKAHEGAIWTLQVHPDGRSMVSGSADKSVKFWKFEIVQEEIPGTKRSSACLKLLHTRTLKVSDDILSLKFSPDSRLLAVALLDNTVKVFFTDSLKLFLNLYGHKLPVLSMDISFDSKLIVTCSADKNVRLWGLDFGDCHKALFAHQDSILQVAFVPHNQDGNGHHFFSSSKDHMIKYWDGDKFEQIQKLDGHHGEIWALAVSRTGTFLVSASHDKSIRVWEQTDEQIFLEEEKERELEELYENTLAVSLDNEQGGDGEGTEVAAAGKQTIETLMAGERIVEALHVGIADLELMKEWAEARIAQPNIAPPPRNPIFLALGGISAETHVMNVLQRVKAAALQDALLILPFSTLPILFTFLNIFAMRSMNIPLTCRILFFLLKAHHRQIVAGKTMRLMLDDIRDNLRQELKRQKDEIGYNLAALRIVGKQVQEKGTKNYVDEETWSKEQDSTSPRKRGFIHVS